MRISDWSSDVCASDLPTYEYNPVPLGNDLRDEVTKIIAGDDPAEGSLGVANEGVQIRQEGDRRALAMALQHLGQANEILGHLAVAFLKRQDHYVQYMTASRHPIEFILNLKKICVDDGLPCEKFRNPQETVNDHPPH